MMKLRGLAYAILILVASVAFITPIRSEVSLSGFRLLRVYWGTDQPREVSPGDVETLTLVLRYEAGYSFENLKADLYLPSGFKAVGGKNKVSISYTGPVSFESIIKLEFPIFVTPDVMIGHYTANLRLEYIYVTAPTREELKVTFEVTGKPSLEVQSLNSSVYEGKQRFLIALTNEGDATAQNFEIVKVHSSSASVEVENTTFQDSLVPGGNVTAALSVFVPSAMKGQILPLTIEASYLGPTNVFYLFSETLQIPVKPFNPVSRLRLDLDPRELIIGKSNRVQIDLGNTGSHSISEIELTLSPDNILKIFGPTVLYINRLGPEERLQVDTEIYVPSTTLAPTASLSVIVTYFDEGVWIAQSENYQLSVLLRGFIEISLTDVAVIPSTPRMGGPFSITITVTNVGTSTAYAAYAVPALEDLPLKAFGPKSVYIGNIELNLPTTFTVNLQLENTTVRAIVLPVTLRYMDNLRSQHNVTFNVPINVAPQTSSTSQTSQRGGYLPEDLLITAGIATVAVVAVVIVVLKRRR